MLQKFNMENCNLIQNSMTINMKFSLNVREEIVENNLYISPLGSLLYVGHLARYIFCNIIIVKILAKPKQNTLGCGKENSEICKGNH